MSDQVHSITDAPQKHSDEQHGRMVRYAVSMAIRMVCFILAVILQNWMTWVLLALAVVLPYVAVTTANVGGDRYMRRSESEDLQSPSLLGTSHEEAAPAADRQWWEDEEDARDADVDPDGYSAQAEIISGELVGPDEAEDDDDDDTSDPEDTDEEQDERR